MDLPTVPSGFLAILRKAYPDRLPRAEVSPFEQGRFVGHQEVLDKLQQLYDKEARRSVPTED
jgi:hypothetical protein